MPGIFIGVLLKQRKIGLKSEKNIQVFRMPGDFYWGGGLLIFIGGSIE
jgi:hypothetical protein